MDTQKLATDRVWRAEELLWKADLLIEKAMVQLSVVTTGLSQEWAKLEILRRDRLKPLIYSLKNNRESGLCDMDALPSRARGKKKL
jgi:hypothetical protein